MVSKSFDINTSALQPFDSSSKKLLVELSAGAVTVILIDRATGKPEAVESFHGPHAQAADWEAMVQQSRLLSLTELETQVVIGYPNMMPMPAALYEPKLAAPQMELYFGSAENLFTSGDVLKELEMVLAWQIPLEEHDFIVNHFQWTQTRHAVSALLQHYQQQTAADGHILVYGSQVWLLLWKNGSFQLAKPVTFQHSDDLSWHLLDLCRQFELSPSDISWQISGLIEEGSALWQVITRFIDPVVPMAATEVPEGLPAHYYAHLFKAL